MSEKQFVEGFWANKPNEKAPDFVKAEISVDLKRFFEWAKEWKNTNPDEKYLRVTVKESQKGEYYGELNTWKPGSKPKETIDEDIPF